MRGTHLITVCTAAALAMVALEAKAEDSLITGTATYEISLDPGKGAVIGSVTGTMTQTLERLCGGYASKVVLSADFGAPEGGGTMPLRIATSHVEQEDGSLTFDVAGKMGPVEIEQAKGSAAKTAEGVIVAIMAPVAEMREIKEKVLFPIEMIKEILRAAKADEKFLEFGIFDGSGTGKEIWRASVVIGAQRTAAEPGEETDFAEAIGVADLKRWPMKISYFDPSSKGEQMPAFSAEATVYENGFSSAAVYDYGQFALRLRLVEFKRVVPEPCPRGQTTTSRQGRSPRR